MVRPTKAATEGIVKYWRGLFLTSFQMNRKVDCFLALLFEVVNVDRPYERCVSLLVMEATLGRTELLFDGMAFATDDNRCPRQIARRHDEFGDEI